MGYRPLRGDTSSSINSEQFQMAAWATYTPSWTSTGSAPSLGDGSLVGGYRREGTTVHLRGQLIVGSTSTVGTGDLRMSLPSGMIATAAQHQSLAGFWFDGNLKRAVAVAEPSTGYMTFSTRDSDTRFPTSALANGHYINWTGTIEIDL